MRTKFTASLLLLSCSSLFTNYNNASACTRFIYNGPSGYTVTARTLDWKNDVDATLWYFPKGLDKNGMVGKNSLKWKSKYGSVCTTLWDEITVDGINEKGLVANLLFYAEPDYPVYTGKGKAKGLTLTAWAQYALDNFASVKEAVAELKKENIIIVEPTAPNGSKYTTLHLTLSDKFGDSAVFEYVNRKLVINHNKTNVVVTNQPSFKEQLALMNYWNGVSAGSNLPGTSRAADRFVRASNYLKLIPNTTDERVAIASVFSVLRNCSNPYGITYSDDASITPTRLRTVADQYNMKYYFESVLGLNTFWVDLKKIDFNKDKKAMKLNVYDFKNFAGEVNLEMEEAKPFTFLGV